MNKYTLYLHRNTFNNKVYIGVTSQEKPENRWVKGKGYKNNPHFYNAILQYGWDNFDHIILEQVDSIDIASARERYWIKYYNSTNPEKGYNLDAGGYDGRHFSDETKEKMRISHLGELNWNYGKEIPLETRQKISEANKGKLAGENNPMYGKTHTTEAREKIRLANQIDKPWLYKKVRCITTGLEFNSIKEATDYYNLGTNGKKISCVCKGTRKSCGKDPETGQPLVWEYIKENDELC